MPIDVAVPELLEHTEDAAIIRSGAEGTAEPRARVDPCDVADRALRLADVLGHPVIGEQRQACMVEGVAPH